MSPPPLPLAQVWIVDDSRLEAQRAHGLLSGTYDVDVFPDAASMLERLTHGAALPHLLLLDWLMPGVSGLETCRYLRQRFDEVTLPILVFTASGQREDLEQAFGAGANDFVSKPYVDAELLSRVRTLVRARVTTAALEEARTQVEAERARLHTLFQNVPAAVATLRGAGHVFESINPLYQRLVGGRRDLLGRPVAQALPEVAAQGFIGLLDGVYRSGEPYVGHDVPIRLRRRDDAALEDTFFTFIFQPCRNAQGHVEGIDVFAFEVTPQVRARQEAEALAERLRQSEARYRTLFESIDDGYCLMQMLLDASGETVDYRFLEANAAFERHTGLKDAVGRTARELVPDLDASWFERYGRVAATGEPWRFESHAPAMGRWFDVYASRVGAPALRLVALVFKDVTERKAAEQERAALLAREQVARAEAVAERQKLHALFEQAPVAIAIHEEPHHTFTFANSAYRALVGGREVLGKPLVEAFPEGTGQGFDAMLDQVVATGTPVYGNEHPAVLTRAGRPETAWFNFVFSPKRNAAGQVDGVMQCAFEVTEQVRARQQVESLAERLRRNEEHLRRVLDVTQVGSWELDPSTRQMVVDVRFRELFGLAPGGPFSLEQGLALVHPEDSPRVTQALSDALSGKGGGHYRVEYRTRRLSDGEERWVEARGQASFDPEGKPTRLLGTSFDVTARKRAELAQEALLEALSAQHLLGVALYRGPRLIIERANPLFLQVVGNGRDVVGLPLREALPELEEEGFVDLIARVLRTGEPFVGREARATFQRRAGAPREEFFFDLVYHPVRGADGRDAVLVLFQDVTQAVRARQFEQQLIGIVSHDLRNPLSAILLGTQTALQREELDERVRRPLLRTHASAERALRMIDDLLDFTQARLGTGLDIKREPMDLGELVTQMVDEVGASFPGREVEVEARGDLRGAWDPDRMAQLLTNLLTNALKYSPVDTPVRVVTRADGDALVLRVHNRGEAIPADKLPVLFEPLQRGTEEVDRTGRSVGLGLYIVDQVVRAHGGRVDVASSQAAGTTFTVHLPRGA